MEEISIEVISVFFFTRKHGILRAAKNRESKRKSLSTKKFLHVRKNKDSKKWDFSPQKRSKMYIPPKITLKDTKGISVKGYRPLSFFKIHQILRAVKNWEKKGKLLFTKTLPYKF